VVEYALLLAHNASGLIPQNLLSWTSEVHWQSVGYAALALVALRLAVWAFRPYH
jgi:cytochrome b